MRTNFQVPILIHASKYAFDRKRDSIMNSVQMRFSLFGDDTHFDVFALLSRKHVMFHRCFFYVIK